MQQEATSPQKKAGGLKKWKTEEAFFFASFAAEHSQSFSYFPLPPGTRCPFRQYYEH